MSDYVGLSNEEVACLKELYSTIESEDELNVSDEEFEEPGKISEDCGKVFRNFFQNLNIVE